MMSLAESAAAVSAFVYALRSSGALAAKPLGSSRIDRVVGSWPETLLEMVESQYGRVAACRHSSLSFGKVETRVRR